MYLWRWRFERHVSFDSPPRLEAAPRLELCGTSAFARANDVQHDLEARSTTWVLVLSDGGYSIFWCGNSNKHYHE